MHVCAVQEYCTQVNHVNTHGEYFGLDVRRGYLARGDPSRFLVHNPRNWVMYQEVMYQRYYVPEVMYQRIMYQTIWYITGLCTRGYVPEVHNPVIFQGSVSVTSVLINCYYKSQVVYYDQLVYKKYILHNNKFVFELALFSLNSEIMFDMTTRWVQKISV